MVWYISISCVCELASGTLLCASLVAQMVKNLPVMQETQVLVTGLGKISRRREWLPILVFLLGELHGQKTLTGYIQSMELQRVGYD